MFLRVFASSGIRHCKIIPTDGSLGVPEIKPSQPDSLPTVSVATVALKSGRSGL
jgi:hypothetical protein